MKTNRKLKRLVVLMLTVILATTSLVTPTVYATEDSDKTEGEIPAYQVSDSEYGDYLEVHKDKSYVEDGISIEMNDKVVNHETPSADVFFKIFEKENDAVEKDEYGNEIRPELVERDYNIQRGECS